MPAATWCGEGEPFFAESTGPTLGPKKADLLQDLGSRFLPPPPPREIGLDPCHVHWLALGAFGELQLPAHCQLLSVFVTRLYLWWEFIGGQDLHLLLLLLPCGATRKTIEASFQSWRIFSKCATKSRTSLGMFTLKELPLCSLELVPQ